MTTTTTRRTIYLGTASKARGPICRSLGIGEYVPQSEAGRSRGRYGWRVSPAELEILLAEIARRHSDDDHNCVQSALERVSANAPRVALDDWRRECADPLSERTPKQAWIYACAANGLPRTTPMPADPPARQPRRPLLDAMNRRDGTVEFSTIR